MTRQVMAKAQTFGTRLKWWRERRGLSQLDLAGAADSSQRHISFLETGRAAPSRDMVLQVAAALDVPLCASRTRSCSRPASRRSGARAIWPRRRWRR
jgi:transcriptional regulator with XRE-family HTH domain